MDKSWVRWRLDAPDITVTKIIIIYCLVYYFFYMCFSLILNAWFTVFYFFSLN